MSEQINLFETIERKERDEKAKRAVREGYRRWLKAPELTPCGRRAVIDYNVHDGIIHRCETMPQDVYMWQNTMASIHGGEYWLLQEPSVSLTGKQSDICPYCRADLCRGEGKRYLHRASGHVYSQKSYRRYYGLDEIDGRKRSEP